MADEESQVEESGAEQETATQEQEAGGNTLLTADPEPEQPAGEAKAEPEPAKEPEDWKIDAVDGWTAQEVELLNVHCKALGMSKDQAMQASEKVKTLRQQENEMLAKRQKDWEAEIRSDPEFGGEKFVGSIETAKRALTTYDTDGTIRKMLNDTGYGSNPAVIRFFARIGRDVREDKVITSRGAQKAERPLEERIWKD